MTTATNVQSARSQGLPGARLPQPADPMVGTLNLVFRPSSGVNSTDTRAGR